MLNAVKKSKGFSIVEMLVSMGLLSGVMVASSLMFKTQQGAQVDLERKVQAISIYGLLSKLFTQQNTCDNLFMNELANSDVAAKMRPMIPEELRKFITLESAIISNVRIDTVAPFELNLETTFEDLDKNIRHNSYRFFIEAKTDPSGKILYCHTVFTAYLSTLCDLVGGDLIGRDQDGDGIPQELSCRLRLCDNNPLAGLYSAPNTSPSHLNLDVNTYQEHHASSRHCFVRYLDYFLTEVSSSNNYLLQNTDDAMSNTLQGIDTATFTTQTQLQARSWCIDNNANCRTVLVDPCDTTGHYVQGIDVAGNVICGPNPVGTCTIVCPEASELCEDFHYDGHDGCGGRCNVTGTRPPACRDGDPTDTSCVGQTTPPLPNGCGDQTCVLRGSRLPTCRTGDTDPNLCSPGTRSESDGCGNTCTIYGTKNCATPTPVPTPTSGSTPTPTTTPGGPTPTPTPSPTAGGPTPTPTTAGLTCNSSLITCPNTKCRARCGSGSWNTLFSGERAICSAAQSGTSNSSTFSRPGGYGTSANISASYSLPEGFVKLQGASSTITYKLDCQVSGNWGIMEFGNNGSGRCSGCRGCVYTNSDNGDNFDVLERRSPGGPWGGWSSTPMSNFGPFSNLRINITNNGNGDYGGGSSGCPGMSGWLSSNGAVQWNPIVLFCTGCDFPMGVASFSVTQTGSGPCTLEVEIP